MKREGESGCDISTTTDEYLQASCAGYPQTGRQIWGQTGREGKGLSHQVKAEQEQAHASAAVRGSLVQSNPAPYLRAERFFLP